MEIKNRGIRKIVVYRTATQENTVFVNSLCPPLLKLVDFYISQIDYFLDRYDQGVYY